MRRLGRRRVSITGSMRDVENRRCPYCEAMLEWRGDGVWFCYSCGAVIGG